MSFPTGWQYYKPVTIESSLVPSTGDYVFALSLIDDPDIIANCKPDGSDIRITDSTGTTLLDFGLLGRGHFASLNGAYTWFHGPYAVYHSGTQSRTYFGYVSGVGDQCVAHYDHSTDEIVPFSLRDQGTAGDDHDNPSVVVRSDGKLLACYCDHNGTEIYRRVSSNAESAAAWAAQGAISPDGTLTSGQGYSYPTLLKFTSEGGGKRIYMIYRSRTPTSWRYSYSDDDGETWAAGAALWTDASFVPYMQAISNGTNRIDFIASDGHGDEGGTAFVHWYYDGTWRSTNGNSAGSPGFIETSFHSSSQVYTSNQRWHSDIILNGSNPWILYYRYNVSGNDQDLWLARWNGSSWTHTKIFDEGSGVEPVNNTHYPGIARFDPEDPTVFYAAVQVSGVYEIQKYSTSDGGDTWTKVADITSGSSRNNFRPYPVRNHGGSSKCKLLWMGNGRYTDYGNYQMGIRMYPPAGHLAAHAIVKANLSSSSDTTLRVYYGNASATDGQNKTAIASGYELLTFASVDHKTGSVETIDDWSTNNRDATLTGNFALGGVSELPSIELRRFSGNDFISYGTAVNLAGENKVAVLTYMNWQEAGTDEHTLIGSWNTGASAANVLLRLEPAGNGIEWFVGVNPNTQIAANPFSGSNVPANAWRLIYADYDNTVASTRRMVGRMDTTEYTQTNATTAALDATATEGLAFGRQHTGTTADSFDGEVAIIAMLRGTLTKAYTDVLSNSLSTQATFATWGAQTDNGLVAVSISTGSPVVDSATLNQTHTLSANSISVNTPTVDSTTLNQTHTLFVSDILGGTPVVDSTTLNQTHTLFVSDILGGTPIVDTTALTTASALVPNAILGGTPVVNSATLNQTHTLLANGVLAGVPTVGSSTIGQTHSLIAIGLVTGSPTVDASMIGGGISATADRKIQVYTQSIVTMAQTIRAW